MDRRASEGKSLEARAAAYLKINFNEMPKREPFPMYSSCAVYDPQCDGRGTSGKGHESDSAAVVESIAVSAVSDIYCEGRHVSK